LSLVSTVELALTMSYIRA